MSVESQRRIVRPKQRRSRGAEGRERESVRRERTHFPESPFWQVDHDTSPQVLSAVGFLWEQLGGGTLRCSRSSTHPASSGEASSGLWIPGLDRRPQRVLEELLAVGSVMSVLIATQHFHTTTSKVVSQSSARLFGPVWLTGQVRWVLLHVVEVSPTSGTRSVKLSGYDDKAADSPQGQCRLWSSSS